MRETEQREIPWTTPRGEVVIRALCTPDDIRGYTFDGQFGTHAHYKSLYTKRVSLEQMAGQTDSNVVLALAGGKDIIGFGVLAYPDADERWSEMGDLMMEVNALEVARANAAAHGVGDRGPFEVRWRNIKIKDLAPEKTKDCECQFTPAPDVKQKAKPRKKKAKKG